jgi:hypothetical protein
VLAGSFNSQFPFAGGIAARLFDIDVLASGTTENRRGRMPVVGSRTDEHIDRLVIQGLAEIADPLRLARLLGSDGREHPIDRPRIDIADVGDFRIRLRAEHIGQSAAAAVDSHDRDRDLVASGLGFLSPRLGDKVRSGGPRGSGSGGGSLQERAAIGWVGHR